jgi:hypothetical protein
MNEIKNQVIMRWQINEYKTWRNYRDN